MSKKRASSSRNQSNSQSDRIDYGELNADELAETTREFDREFVRETFAPMTPGQRKRWQRSKHRGRQRKRAHERSLRLLITLPPSLLQQLDRVALKRRQPRSSMIQEGILIALAMHAAPEDPVQATFLRGLTESIREMLAGSKAHTHAMSKHRATLT